MTTDALSPLEQTLAAALARALIREERREAEAWREDRGDERHARLRGKRSRAETDAAREAARDERSKQPPA